MEEEWKDIVGYEGLYQVSNLGRVRSVDRVRKYREFQIPIKGRILKSETRNRYKSVSLCKNGIMKHWSIHRLVALMFVPNTENKDYIDHIDGNCENNYFRNLRWCTAKENSNNPITCDRGRKVFADNWKLRSRRIYQYSIEGCFIKEWVHLSQASKELKISRSGIRSCCEGLKKDVGGFRWSYEKKDILESFIQSSRIGKIAKMDLDGNVLSLYDNLKEAANSIGCRSQDISNCIRGWRKTVCGYKFTEV